jgi:C_GCAxxG_C_C family probable redox protein
VSNDRSKRSVELFTQGCNCAQSVFAGCATGKKLTEAQRLALAAPFGGGVAHRGEVCGTLTGALLALAEAGEEATVADPVGGRKAVDTQAQQLIENFRTANGSILCRELTGCLLSTEEGQRSFKEREKRKNVCAKLVAFAAEQVDKAIAPASQQK